MMTLTFLQDFIIIYICDRIFDRLQELTNWSSRIVVPQFNFPKCQQITGSLRWFFKAQQC